jgi:hypothetical protein
LSSGSEEGWLWMSTKPGITINPAPSITVSAGPA